MRLVRLRLGEFRPQQELRLEFARRPGADPALAFLVGPNGAGKSRVLEALGRIFSHLAAGVAPGMDFDLEYELREQRVLVTTRPPLLAGGAEPPGRCIGQVEAWLLVAPEPFRGWGPGHVHDRWPTDADSVLPFRVLGLSTGPTSRLDWALRHSVRDTLVQRTESEGEAKETGRSGLPSDAEPRCVALSGNELLLAVLALLSHPASSRGEDPIRDEILDRAGLDARESLRAFTFDVAGDWRGSLPGPLQGPFERLLKRASTRLRLEREGVAETEDPPEPDQRAVFEAAAVRTWIDAAAETPFIWFNQLLSWLNAGVLTGVRLVLKKRDGDGLLLDYDFSDGEFLLTGRYGLLLLLRGHEDCLVLFDEPETHFNDRWKVDLVRDLERVLAGGSAQVAIATHSDLTLSDADRTDVHMLELEPRPEGVEVSRQPPVSPLAADREEITRQVFGAAESSGQRGVELVEAALASGERRRLEEARERVGPGYNRFRLEYALRELGDDDAA